jgi:D-sedoheptulose 7-phosphate isomerase
MSEVAVVLQKILDGSDIDHFVDLLRKHNVNRVWLVGNGGSASSAIHLSSDLEAVGYDVVCLVSNISRLTAIANDFGWDEIFIRQMGAFKPSDVLIVFSVHGGVPRKDGGEVWSGNLLRACKLAKEKGGVVLALLGGDGGQIGKVADVSVVVPHSGYWVVEGVHSCLAHVICKKLLEK